MADRIPNLPNNMKVRENPVSLQDYMNATILNTISGFQFGLPISSNTIQVGGGYYPSESKAAKYYDKLQAIQTTLKSVNQAMSPNTLNQFEYKIRELYDAEVQLNNLSEQMYHYDVQQIGGMLSSTYVYLKNRIKQLIKGNEKIYIVLNNLLNPHVYSVARYKQQ